MFITARRSTRVSHHDAPDLDRRPGSMDIEWAEQAYRDRGEQAPPGYGSRAVGPSRHAPRTGVQRRAPRRSTARRVHVAHAVRTVQHAGRRGILRSARGLRAAMVALVVVLAALGLGVGLATPASTPVVGRPPVASGHGPAPHRAAQASLRSPATALGSPGVARLGSMPLLLPTTLMPTR